MMTALQWRELDFRITSDDGRPLPYPPARHQTVDDVRVDLRERFGSGGRVAAEQQHAAIERVGERTAQDQFAPLHCGTSMSDVGGAVRTAALHDIGHVIVEK